MTDLDYQFGAELQIGNMVIRHPTIREILNYGEENFLSAVNLFLMKPSDMMVQLDDSGIDYTQITPYVLFTFLCSEILVADENGKESEIRKRLEWLTGIDDFEMVVENDDLILRGKDSGAVIDIAVYMQIRRYLMKLMFRSDKEKYNPGNEVTRKAIIAEERRKQNRAKKRRKETPSFFASQVSSLVWGNHNGYKYNDVLEMPLYQFNDGLYRLNRIKNYDFNMMGYYSGNISSKDIKGIEDKIDWMAPN